MQHNPITRRRAAIALAACAILLAACSGGGSKSSHSKLTISATSRLVKAGQPAITLTADVGSSTAAVSWRLLGPGALAATAGAATDYVPPAALADSSVATVSATCGDAQGEVQIQVLSTTSLDPVTVTGKVLDEDGNPVTAQAVIVAGHPGVGTNDLGEFTVADVAPPYDVAVIIDASQTVYIYRGLTIANPTLFMWNQADNQTRLADRNAKLNGLVSGGDGAGSPARINFASKELNQWYDPDSITASSIAAPGPYSLALEWNGPITTTGTVLGLQYRPDPGSGAPVAYWYAYQPDVTVLAGQPAPLMGPSLYLMPSATDSVQGVISVPPKYALLEKFIGLTFPNGNNFGVFRDTFSIAQLNFLYQVPMITGARPQICARAEDLIPVFAGARSISCISTEPVCCARDKQLEVREAPEPYLPANNGRGVCYSTVFSWTPFKDGIHVVQIIPDRPGCDDLTTAMTAPPSCLVKDPRPKFVINTADSSTRIPDLRSFGLGLVPSTNYHWRVRGMGPFMSVDDFARYPVAVPPFDLPTAPEPAAFWAKSRKYEFTVCDDLSVCPPVCDYPWGCQTPVIK